MPTAYLSPSLLQDLTNVSVSPGAGNTGYPLVWNNATGQFELAVLGVAGGGTGTSNGSITGTGALTFTAGGTNQNIALNPSGTGFISCGNTVVGPGLKLGDSPLSPGRLPNPINRVSAEGRRLDMEYYVASNDGQQGYVASLANRARGTLANPESVQAGDRVFGFLTAARGPGAWQANASGFLFEVDGIVSGEPEQRIIFETGGPGSGGTPFKVFPRTVVVAATTESTSTTTGACTIAGGLGVVGNVNIGGNLRFAGGTVPATAASAGTTGDIRYDGSHLYICTATNTWVRTALSTW